MKKETVNNFKILSADNKALRINLDKSLYGTFAEIGAGQEVARHFFRVGGASKTIAKTMSAYDMTFSDEIYGKSTRYVSRERLQSMLNHEYQLLIDRLSEKRGKETNFFAFANTVAAKNYKGNNESHGWMGVRFQTDPLSQPNDVVIHVRMTDKENVMQQQALGTIGVNLLYGVFFYLDNLDKFISSLLDELSLDRIEIDMIEFSGPEMQNIDNRLMSLKLVQRGLTNAVMFAANKKVLQPSEVLFKKPIIVARGSFRPITHVNLDMIESAKNSFKADTTFDDKNSVVLFEITLNNLMADGTLDDADFIARADTLSALGYPVLISNYSEHYRLTSYFRRYSHECIVMVMGINTLLQIFNEKYYSSLEGGILEALGRLFRQQVRLYIHPMRRGDYVKLVNENQLAVLPIDVNTLPDIVDSEDVTLPQHLKHLYKHLCESGNIVSAKEFNSNFLSIFSREVLNEIQKGGSDWENAVPSEVSKLIKKYKLFGYLQNSI